MVKFVNFNPIWETKISNLAPNFSLFKDSLDLAYCICISTKTVDICFFTYYCQNGFYFQLDIDECEDLDPCQNDGLCLNDHGGYDCLCPDGFEGTVMTKNFHTFYYFALKS